MRDKFEANGLNTMNAMHSFTFDNVIITLVNFVKISHPSLTIIY